MTPERKAIIDAIQQGYQTPKSIGEHLGKPPHTISKLLYVMSKKGLLKKVGYARYIVGNYIEQSIDKSVNISLLQIDKLIQQRVDAALLARLGSEAESQPVDDEKDYTDKSERVFKKELALAVHHLIMTVGMPQKEVAALLGLSHGDVSRLKDKGTKLHQQKR